MTVSSLWNVTLSPWSIVTLVSANWLGGVAVIVWSDAQAAATARNTPTAVVAMRRGFFISRPCTERWTPQDTTPFPRAPGLALRGRALPRLRGRGRREPHALVLERPVLEHPDVARVVLVEPPRRPHPLLGELVDRPHHVAGVEVDERLDRLARGRGLRQSTCG